LREKNKTGAAKNTEKRKVGNLAIKPFIWGQTRQKRSRHPIKKISCSEHSFSPKNGRHRGG
jgi:hypothetical protein